MILSTKSRYGLKAVYELALLESGGTLPLKDIAEKQKISESYLEQIFAVLRRAGVVTAVRGAQGGYMLSEPPEDITVGQVIRALDGDLSPAKCLNDDGDACANADSCVTRPIWEKLRSAIDETVDSISLKDMTNESKCFRDKQAGAGTDYDGTCK